jgi:hypothetical protein
MPYVHGSGYIRRHCIIHPFAHGAASIRSYVVPKRTIVAELLKTPLRVYYFEGIALQGVWALPASKRVSSRHRPGVGRPFFFHGLYAQEVCS